MTQLAVRAAVVVVVAAAGGGADADATEGNGRVSAGNAATAIAAPYSPPLLRAVEPTAAWNVRGPAYPEAGASPAELSTGTA